VNRRSAARPAYGRSGGLAWLCDFPSPQTRSLRRPLPGFGREGVRARRVGVIGTAALERACRRSQQGQLPRAITTSSDAFCRRRFPVSTLNGAASLSTVVKM
jgi:hypothetical protein